MRSQDALRLKPLSASLFPRLNKLRKKSIMGVDEERPGLKPLGLLAFSQGLKPCAPAESLSSNVFPQPVKPGVQLKL